MPRYEGTACRITKDTVLAAYLDTACWSSTGEDGKTLYAHRLTKAAQKQMAEDLADFLAANEELIGDRQTDAAEDFWMTRNGVGVGFWDGGWPEPAATELTKNAKAYGSVTLMAYRGWINVY